MPTGNLGVLDFDSAYAVSFGALKNGTVYYSPDYTPTKAGMPMTETKSDFRGELKAALDRGLKALGATSTTGGGTGTAGIGMIPIYVDPVIVDASRKYTPFVEAVQRRTNMGLTADFNKITAKGAAKALAEDAPLSDVTETISRTSVGIKYIYSTGRVTGQARASYPPYMLEGFQPTGAGQQGSSFTPMAAPNAKQLEVVLRARAMKEEEERLIVNGAIATDANEFDGIVALQSTTNKVDKNTSALEYADVETAIQYSYDDSGRVNLAASCSSALGDLRKIMVDTFHYRPIDMTTSLNFGVGSYLTLETMVGPVPVMPSQYLTNTSGSKAIYFLDMNWIEMRVLQDMTYEDLSKTNDSEKFMLKIYEALVMKNTAFNSFIGEIA